jgi:UPF0755 protein
MVASVLRRLLKLHPLVGPAVVAVVLLAMTALGWVWYLNQPTGQLALAVTVDPGLNARTIGQRLDELALVRSGHVFAVLARLKGLEGRLQAGTYRLDGRRSTAQLVEDLLQSPPVPVRVTIPEGFTRTDIAGLLARAGVVDSARFVAVTGDSGVARRLGLAAPSLEGYLFPETYFLAASSTAEDVARTMVSQFRAVMSPHLQGRLTALGLSLHQAVTLASIVEREARVQAERALIAGVFRRRLQLGMRLESCATVEYAMGIHKEHLSNSDIEFASPYNTYLAAGLPPGPIGNPGLASLTATLFAADTDFLYFVARGDGTHVFSRDLRAHERAKHRLRQPPAKPAPRPHSRRRRR